MIILLTGQPGNGKSLRAMALAAEEYERNAAAVKAGKESPRDFFSNIAGSTTDENPDAFPWMQLLPEHNDWTRLPEGAFVMYDEAHSDGKTPGLERYGLLFPSTGKPGESDDPRIRAMSTHRHRGVDLVLMTQWPSKIHHQVRSLVGKHLHMNRAMGLQKAGVYTWTRVQVDPYDERQREKGEEEIWAYDKSLYTRYKSATLHTATYKFKIPKKVWQGLSTALVLVLMMWGLWAFIFKPDDTGHKDEGAAQGQAPSGAAAPPFGGVSRTETKKGWASDADYLGDHKPRFHNMPWTAPIYDDRKPTVDPLVVCMVGGDGVDGNGEFKAGSCTCLTEQGTRYRMEESECRTYARHGPAYNPYRQTARAADFNGDQPSSSEPLRAPLTGPVSVDPGVAPGVGAEIPAYGAMREPRS